MKFDKGRILTWLLLFFIAAVVFNIYILIRERDRIYDNVSVSLEKKIKNSIPKVQNGRDGQDGRTPIKGIDYFDGLNGINGQTGPQGIQGENGDTGEKGEDGIDGENGLTPELRCNTKKNRWEVRYDPTDNWKVLNGESVKCMVEE